MRDYRNPRPAFAPPPPEPGAGSPRAVGRGKGPECHGTLRGPRAGEMEEGGRTGIGWASTEERRTAFRGRSLRRVPPGLVDGRSPSAMRLSKARVGAVRRAACTEPICGGTLPSTAAAEATEELGGGCGGRARAAPALPRGLAGEGALASASWGEVAVHDQAGACAGGSSSAQ